MSIRSLFKIFAADAVSEIKDENHLVARKGRRTADLTSPVAHSRTPKR